MACENRNINCLLEIIRQNIGTRKLVLRWKDEEIEQEIFDKLGIKAEFYVTRSQDRIDNTTTFSDEVLRDKSKDYFLVILFGLKWNDFSRLGGDDKRYLGMGYEYEKDVLWFQPKPEHICVESNSTEYSYANKYGNRINSKSKANIEFCGINSFVDIGNNVKMPKEYIRIGNGVRLIIKDNVNLSMAHFIFADNTNFEVEENVDLSKMEVFINNSSTVTIGKNTTMQTGKLRTGRNQKVVIGEDCMFSWDIVFCPHDGHLIWDINSKKCVNNTIGDQRESISIGNHVWIGGETVIMPNTYIGSGSICGYRSLVKGIVPNNCIVAGSPAAILKKDIAWSRTNISYNDQDFYKIPQEFRKLTNSIEDYNTNRGDNS